MLGSAASVANPNIVLNTAVAEILRQFSQTLEHVPPEDMEQAVHNLLKATISAHKRIIFNGNGYTDEWVEEAQKRGLFNLKTTPDALPEFISEKNVALFAKHHIFTKGELHSRYEIWLENYTKTLHIEACTMAEMVQKDLLPAIFTYMEQVARTASLKKAVLDDISTASETVLLKKLTLLQDKITDALEVLRTDTSKVQIYADILTAAKAYQTAVLKDMEDLRKYADEAEALLPENLLPYPTYGKLLFSI